jgi:hypothetical protein
MLIPPGASIFLILTYFQIVIKYKFNVFIGIKNWRVCTSGDVKYPNVLPNIVISDRWFDIVLMATSLANTGQDWTLRGQGVLDPCPPPPPPKLMGRGLNHFSAWADQRALCGTIKPPTPFALLRSSALHAFNYTWARSSGALHDCTQVKIIVRPRIIFDTRHSCNWFVKIKKYWWYVRENTKRF